MRYFDGIKRENRVWDFVNLWGTVTKVTKDTIYVDFDNGAGNTFTFDGKTLYGNEPRRQQLFWDEIKFEIPKSPKIKLKEDEFLIQFYYNKVEKLDKPVELGYLKTNGLTRNDEEMAKKALKTIKRFTRLLAIRDQECPNSRGYEFQSEKENYYIFKNERTNKYDYDIGFYWNCLGVYFSTPEDAQKICDILNSGKFDLEGE